MVLPHVMSQVRLCNSARSPGAKVGCVAMGLVCAETGRPRRGYIKPTRPRPGLCTAPFPGQAVWARVQLARAGRQAGSSSGGP